jgi:A/G-specific adenine glycosylase
MPWREETSPYRTWISEIMLQQTQVSTVVPYFERFLRRFPTLTALARAPEGEVLRLWAGLGYYSRARNLLRAARTVVAEHGGRLPPDYEALRRLPGFGPYTAAAVASIAFGRPHAVLDGNVARVLCRLHALRGDPRRPTLMRKLQTLAQEALDLRRPGDWNQAMMELGATVCLPSPAQPLCGACPLRERCRARALDLQERIPPARRKASTLHVRMDLLRIEQTGHILLWRRALDEPLLPGHWGLPERRHLPSAPIGGILRRCRHSITRHDIYAIVHKASAPTRLPASARWFSSSSARKTLIASLWMKALSA